MLSIVEVEIDVETIPTILISKALSHIKLYWELTYDSQGEVSAGKGTCCQADNLSSTQGSHMGNSHLQYVILTSTHKPRQIYRRTHTQTHTHTESLN